jgi:NADH-ubiquinone oxidoreductase chain 4L
VPFGPLNLKVSARRPVVLDKREKVSAIGRVAHPLPIELMLLAVNLNFLVFSVYLDDMMGQLFALFVLTVAAAESAIGLAILVITFRIRGTIAVEFRATVRVAYSHCLAIWRRITILCSPYSSKPRETLFRVPGIELT